MQRLRYAFRFIAICFSLAIKQSRLRKPWFKMWMGGISLIILWLVPLGVVIFFTGLDPLGMGLIGLIIILLLISLLVWGEVTALETCKVFDALIVEDLSPEQAETNRQKDEVIRWQDVTLWMFSLPGLELLRLLKTVFQPQKAHNLDWLGAAYLMLPIISLEDHRLTDATARIRQLVRDHLLRFHPSLVGIKPIAGIIQWFLILVGGALGTWLGFNMAHPSTANVLSRLFAAALGTMLAGILALLGIFFSSFMRACYYTTLYHWALSVESARASGDPSQGKPPAILGQVMRKTKLSKKE